MKKKATNKDAKKENTSELLPLGDYDKLFVCFSGGKDSMAAVLDLLDRGVPKSKIVLLHHLIDGAPGSQSFMDWPITEDYCRAVAKHLGVRILFSWKVGGFYREMMRDNSLTAPIQFEMLSGQLSEVLGGTRGNLSTRRKFPQVSADMSVRWCSSYLKMNVGARFLTNDPELKVGKFLVLTGERREESAGRAKYAEIIKHATTTKNRRVDQWRSIIDWSETQVWEIMKRYGINPHPAYQLGWGRVSCITCIFGDKDQWASVRALAPTMFEKIADLETEFECTIKRNETVRSQADAGVDFVSGSSAEIKSLSMGKVYNASVSVKEGEWVLPAGAGKVGCGGSI